MIKANTEFRLRPQVSRSGLGRAWLFAVLFSLFGIIAQARDGALHDAPKCSEVFAFESYRSVPLSPREYPVGAKVRSRALRKEKIQVLVWNVHKFKSPDLAGDLTKFAKTSDVVLLQEARMDATTVRFFSRLSHLYWDFVRSFDTLNGHMTGVITGTIAKPVESEPLWSPVSEPITRTPKTTLVSRVEIEGENSSLLIANIHGINFVDRHSFKMQIDQVYDALKDHQGPVLFAGDFNTWSRGRLRILLETAQRLGLWRVDIKNQRGQFLTGVVLDHVFVRGLTVRRAESIPSIKSSDHAPLTLELAVLNEREVH